MSMPVNLNPLLIIFRERRRAENRMEGQRGPHLGTGATLIPTFSQEHRSCGLDTLKPFFLSPLGHSFPLCRMGLKSFPTRLPLLGALMRKLQQTAESRLKQKQGKLRWNLAPPSCPSLWWNSCTSVLCVSESVFHQAFLELVIRCGAGSCLAL